MLSFVTRCTNKVNKRMTTKFDDAEIESIIKMLASGSDNSNARLQTVLLAVSNVYGCTPQTVRNHIIRHPELYEVTYGFIRIKPNISETSSQQEQDLEDFSKWLKLRESVLDECVEFLKGIPFSPLTEIILIGIGNARQELQGYSEVRFRQVLLDLRKSFGFEPKTEI